MPVPAEASIAHSRAYDPVLPIDSRGGQSPSSRDDRYKSTRVQKSPPEKWLIDDMDETELSEVMMNAHTLLSDVEKKAIRSYTKEHDNGEVFRQIKADIRNPHINPLSTGAIIHNAVADAPPTDMDVLHLYRGFETEEQRDRYINLNCGSNFAFSFSATIHPASYFADKFASKCCILRLVVPRNTRGILYIAPISTDTFEEEVLVLPTVRMRHVASEIETEYLGGIQVTTMEVCPDPLGKSLIDPASNSYTDWAYNTYLSAAKAAAPYLGSF